MTAVDPPSHQELLEDFNDNPCSECGALPGVVCPHDDPSVTSRLNEADLEIITGCAAAHPDRRDGQHVAKKCTAVRVLHAPSGIAVTVTRERSQRAAKTKAITLLRRLL